MITVFYDGQCGLCSKEIAHYQRIAPEGIFTWRDANCSEDALRQLGVSVAGALKLLHAVDNNGRLHIGVDAFILMWAQLKRWRILATLVALPGIRQLVDISYRGFAKWRFKRLSHCQIAEGQRSP
ncbi:DUF393 domain-containing protein [Porticoccus sp. W117]|uniref:thiol-disulfide oxidoreductase DCC family protein n=1 Tax=Porticoccus sp. W117 TaxID=3054777 RepID=UPI00259755ED|nr:DUF393 domain-containing protein [Porticoccus sp. W117]MDM3872490.1 DUF393 domain-containing protein [Porticoccus sp. W117]